MLDGPVEGVCAFYGYRCVGGGGQDVAVGHGAGGGFELVADRLLGAAAFEDVAVNTTDEAEVVGGVDEDAEVVEGAEFGIVEGEDAFDEEGGAGLNGLGVGGDAGVGGEVVDGALDGVTGGECAEVLDEEIVLDGVGVVEVLQSALGGGEVAEVAVVEVEGEQGCVEVCGEFAGEGGFAGAGTASDGEDEGATLRCEGLRGRHSARVNGLGEVEKVGASGAEVEVLDCVDDYDADDRCGVWADVWVVKV